MVDEKTDSTDEARPQYSIPVPGIFEPVEDDEVPEQSTVLMYAPNDGQYAVLLRVTQQVTARGGDRKDVARNIGMMYRLLDALVVKAEDRAWIDEMMVSGELSPEDALGLTLDLLREHVASLGEAKAPKNGPVRRVVASKNRTRK